MLHRCDRIAHAAGAFLQLCDFVQFAQSAIQNAAPDQQMRQARTNGDRIGCQLGRLFKRLDRQIQLLTLLVEGRNMIQLLQGQW